MMVTMEPLSVLSMLAGFLLTLESVICIKLPTDIHEDMYCSGCEAVISEVHKQLLKKSSLSTEIRVVEALDDLCEADHFKAYKYIPPKMVRVCKLIIERHDEALEELLVRHYSVMTPRQEDVTHAVCHGLTKACVNKPIHDEDDDKTKIFMDGEELKVKYGHDAKIVKPVKEVKDEL